MADQNDSTVNTTLYDESGNKIGIILDGSIYRLASTNIITNASGSKIVTVTTDGVKERLDVNASFSPPSPNQGKYISVFLRNGTNIDLGIDGSATPVVFSRGPGTGKLWFITRMILVIRDGGITWNTFGGTGNLTNGCTLDYDSGGVNIDLLDGTTWRRNYNMARHCYDVLIDTATVDQLNLRWTFTKSGTALQLNNANSDTFNCTVNDDLSKVNNFNIVIQGIEVNE